MQRAIEREQLRATRFWKDVRFLFLWPPRLLRLEFGMDRQLRERVMLAVSEVNGCAMCAHFHARLALKAGIDNVEVQEILRAGYDSVPNEHLTAVLFAQHWADTQGDVDPEARMRLDASYEAETVARIMLSIRFINTMNFIMGKAERVLGRGKAKR